MLSDIWRLVDCLQISSASFIRMRRTFHEEKLDRLLVHRRWIFINNHLSSEWRWRRVLNITHFYFLELLWRMMLSKETLISITSNPCPRMNILVTQSEWHDNHVKIISTSFLNWINYNACVFSLTFRWSAESSYNLQLANESQTQLESIIHFTLIFSQQTRKNMKQKILFVFEELKSLSSKAEKKLWRSHFSFKKV